MGRSVLLLGLISLVCLSHIKSTQAFPAEDDFDVDVDVEDISSEGDAPADDDTPESGDEIPQVEDDSTVSEVKSTRAASIFGLPFINPTDTYITSINNAMKAAEVAGLPKSDMTTLTMNALKTDTEAHETMLRTCVKEVEGLDSTCTSLQPMSQEIAQDVKAKCPDAFKGNTSMNVCSKDGTKCTGYYTTSEDLSKCAAWTESAVTGNTSPMRVCQNANNEVTLASNHVMA